MSYRARPKDVSKFSRKAGSCFVTFSRLWFVMAFRSQQKYQPLDLLRKGWMNLFTAEYFFSTLTLQCTWQCKEEEETKCFPVRRILYGHCSQMTKSGAASFKLEEIFSNPCGLTIDTTKAQGRPLPFPRKPDGDRTEAVIRHRGSWPWTNTFLTTTPQFSEIRLQYIGPWRCLSR